MLIYKKTLAYAATERVWIEQGAVILSADEMYDKICIWYTCDPKANKAYKNIHVYGTGHPIANAYRLKFIGTVKLTNGTEIFHVFEEG